MKLNGAVPLRVALYLRKSTSEDRDKDPELKSTGMQETNARKYALKKGWKVVDVYRDDNVSGALVSRPAFDRLKAALGIEEGKPFRRAPDLSRLPFDVILCRDQSRLTRNGDLATHQIRQLLRTGVNLAYYRTGEVLDAATFKPLAVGMQGFVDSDHREQARHNVREGLAEYARKGHSVGNVCFGYVNKPVMGRTPSGQPTRLYTDLAKHPQQARIVVQVFAMFADGHSPRVIARAANGDPEYADLRHQYFDGKSPPKPPQGNRGSGEWSRSSIRDMLRNSRYLGVLVFGRTQQLDDDYGQPYRIRQGDPEKIIRTERPDLRVVPPKLWATVQRRLAKLRNQTLRLREEA